MTPLSPDALYWPLARGAEGLELLARTAGLPVRSSTHATAAPGLGEREHLILDAAAALELDVDTVDTTVGGVDAFLRTSGPAIVRVGADSLLMLVACRGGSLRTVCPDHRVAWVSREVVRRAIVEPEAAPLRDETARLIEAAGVAPAKRATVVRALVNERLRTRKVPVGWVIRIPHGASFRAQLVAAGARRRAAWVVALHALQYIVWVCAWWLLGTAALQGRFDPAWLAAWTLALFTLLPLQLGALWLQGTLAIRVGALFKQRLLAGALRLDPEEIRTDGAGRLLGRVIEAEAVESLALGGGVMAVLAAVELVIAGGVLALAAPLLSALLVMWAAVAAALTFVYVRRRTDWVRLRVALTHDVIEKMLGHRTRAAQQPRDEWHHGEDETIERYVRASTVMDRAAVSLIGLVPRGWTLLGLCGLAPLFVSGAPATSLAIGLGGVLLAFRAFDRLTSGLWSLTGAAIAWRQTASVFAAAARSAGSTASTTPLGANRDGSQLEASDLRFTHAGRSDPVLRGCSLAIAPGDKVLLEGPSGGGKSTLASILSGLRSPQSGLLLLGGLDPQTLGLAAWRRRVVLVPQFHENHVVLGSVAFNALMGVDWPPSEGDFGRADALLRELGLGDTLDRMPSGLLQTVGETGWQLSHGERSRLYLARALLQNPDILILDESFAQLDPENMHRALTAVNARARSVLLIAHP